MSVIPPVPPYSFDKRSSGVLLHLTSLPGKHGCGDLGPEAHRFLEFLKHAGQSWWQMLPIGPPGRSPAFSPYDSASTFAGSPLLVSLSMLARDGLLRATDLAPGAGLSSRMVNFPATWQYREARLRQAYGSFRDRHADHQRSFRQFCDRNSGWLEDFALFAALRRESGDKPWTQWEDDLRRRRPSALRAAKQRLADEVGLHRFVQFEFSRQWQELRRHARRCGIGLIGDLPIFVAHDSADVWCNQELFQLDVYGRSRQVSGYPPGRFNRRGQLWGHPQYCWAAHQRSGFEWWVNRFDRLFELFDAVRIDHFLGFTRCWSIPCNATHARNGCWVTSPGRQLLAAVKRRLGRRAMIAEDLGLITPAATSLREEFGLVPMRIFQFGFDNEEGSAIHLPHNYPRMCAAYTGSHDTDTVVGWVGGLSPAGRKRVLAYTGGRPKAIHQDSMRMLQSSCAHLVMLPLQDVLGLGRQARMNVPGTVENNWRWRIDAIPSLKTAKALRSQTALYGRCSEAR